MNRLFYDKIINMRKKNASKGLTFLEMLVVVGILVVLVAAVIFAVQPGERLAKSRDNQREVHLNTIWHAVKQKAHMEGGWENCNPLPTDYFTPIGTDADAYDLFSCLVPEYLASEVYDPLEGTLVNTKYSIWQNANTEHLSLRAQNSETRFVSAGGAGGALSFDGTNDSVALAEPPAASTNINNGSVFAWLKTSNAGSGDRGIIIKQLAYGIFLQDNIFGVYDWGNTAWRTSGVNLADGSWHFAGFTFENIAEANPSDNAKLYINGQYLTTVTYKLSSQDEGIVMGAGDNPATLQFFSGFIDEVRLYNRVLSDQEVEQLYYGNHITDGLVGYWPLNEMQGCAANDYSGNLNHGGLGPDCPTDAPEWTIGR